MRSHPLGSGLRWLKGSNAKNKDLITYSLKNAVAFFAENLSGARQVTAQEMDVAVEEGHLSSENNPKEETKAALDQYFALFESFTKGS